MLEKEIHASFNSSSQKKILKIMQFYQQSCGYSKVFGSSTAWVAPINLPCPHLHWVPATEESQYLYMFVHIKTKNN